MPVFLYVLHCVLSSIIDDLHAELLKLDIGSMVWPCWWRFLEPGRIPLLDSKQVGKEPGSCCDKDQQCWSVGP